MKSLWPAEVDIECIGLNIILSLKCLSLLYAYVDPPLLKKCFMIRTILNHCNSNREIMLIGDFNINWDNERKKLKQLAGASVSLKSQKVQQEQQQPQKHN